MLTCFFQIFFLWAVESIFSLFLYKQSAEEIIKKLFSKLCEADTFPQARPSLFNNKLKLYLN